MMNKRHLAAILPALALGISLPALAVDSTSKMQNRSVQVAPGDTAGANKAEDTSNRTDTDTNSNANDTSAPADQSSMDKDESTNRDAKKHPPTNRMDSAVPPQTSPGTSSSGSQDSSSSDSNDRMKGQQ
jgi:hypothetical protein